MCSGGSTHLRGRARRSPCPCQATTCTGDYRTPHCADGGRGGPHVENGTGTRLSRPLTAISRFPLVGPANREKPLSGRFCGADNDRAIALSTEATNIGSLAGKLHSKRTTQRSPTKGLVEARHTGNGRSK